MDVLPGTQIRPATLEDRDVLVALGQDFLSSSPITRQADTSLERIAALVDRVLTFPGHGGLVFEVERHVVGMLGFVMGDHPISGIRTMFEVAWFIREEDRGGPGATELIRQAAEIARACGCKRFQVGSPNAIVGRFLYRQGFRVLETQYVMEFD